ncbi:MAG: glycosyltransferase family 2 protein [Acetobacteraceae bacterium]|nr:glycosyltransferase family 2 protein [Acetobacteraceae bacterium]
MTQQMSIQPTVCLNMIVKNEAPVIRRCLDSVRPIIHHWVIIDTGSTDGTQSIIREQLRDVPGELYERPWRDFAWNRSEALRLARDRADYSFVIDADDTLEVEPGFVMPGLDADSYKIAIQDTSIHYERKAVVSNRLPWRYEGVLHEFLTCEDARTERLLPGLRIRRNHDGARRRDPQTYSKDAAVLERALQTATSPFLISRYRFYLAQSYRDCGEKQKAIENYLARAELGFWQEEVFVSLYQAAQLKAQLDHPDQDVIDTYLRASQAAPNRAEALHGASRLCRNKRRYEEGFQFAKRGLAIPLPSDGLFVESWIYQYGLLDELGVCASWTGRYSESLDACERILREHGIPEAQRRRIEGNAEFVRKKLAPSNLGGTSFDRANQQSQRRLKIAVYTIALNEARHVERWRSSADDADYLVVADTGSTDDTVERLSTAGVQVNRPAVRPWRFDDARNASLALVPSDADICICLDMDEFMLPNWRALVQDAWAPGTTRLSYNFAPSYSENNSPNHSYRKSKIHARYGYRWKRVVHEDLDRTAPDEIVSQTDALLIGQIQDATKNRSQYLPLLAQAHAEDPQDSQVCFWFARDLMYAGRSDQSAQKYLEYLSLPRSNWPDERSQAIRFLARVQPGRKREWLLKAMVEAPHRREIWMDLAEFHHAERDWPNLFWACVNGIEKTRRTGSYLDDVVAWGYRLYDLGAVACSHLGLIGRAIEWGTQALAFMPDDNRLTDNLAHYRGQACRTTEA